LKEPKSDARFVVRWKVNLTCEAAQVLHRLCRYMIEIDNVANCVEQREEKCCACSNLMELKHTESRNCYWASFLVIEGKHCSETWDDLYRPQTVKEILLQMTPSQNPMTSNHTEYHLHI